jgi:hypothetical protein
MCLQNRAIILYDNYWLLLGAGSCIINVAYAADWPFAQWSSHCKWQMIVAKQNK